MMRSIPAWLALLAVCGTLLLAGCKGGSKRSGDVVATVNGKGIPRSEVEKYYENQTAGSPQKPTPAQESALKLNFLRELIDREIMMQRSLACWPPTTRSTSASPRSRRLIPRKSSISD
jgi:hypothetical protein